MFVTNDVDKWATDKSEGFNPLSSGAMFVTALKFWVYEDDLLVSIPYQAGQCL